MTNATSSKQETLDYIGAMLKELSRMAKANDLPDLAYLISLGHREAAALGRSRPQAAENDRLVLHA